MGGAETVVTPPSAGLRARSEVVAKHVQGVVRSSLGFDSFVAFRRCIRAEAVFISF